MTRHYSMPEIVDSKIVPECSSDEIEGVCHELHCKEHNAFYHTSEDMPLMELVKIAFDHLTEFDHKGKG